MYYLQSRHYDPVAGRFLNTDAVPQVGFANTDVATNNLFAYCLNSPINMSDIDGNYAIAIIELNYIASSGRMGQVFATNLQLSGSVKTLCGIYGFQFVVSRGKSSRPEKLYKAIKERLSSLGCAYLTKKGYLIAAAAYYNGMWGEGKELSIENQQKMISKIRKCQEFKDARKALIKRIKKGEKYPGCEVHFNKDMDMHYTLQHAEMKMKFDKHTRRYKVTIKDTYNFDYFRDIITESGVSFSNAANNLGLVMQKCGMMTPYPIKLVFYT